MPLFMSGSNNTCTGSLRGVFSGSIPQALTGSYTNISGYWPGKGGPFDGVCTGSMVIHTDNRPGDAVIDCQRLFIMLSGSAGPEWVFITGSLGCTDPLP